MQICNTYIIILCRAGCGAERRKGSGRVAAVRVRVATVGRDLCLRAVRGRYGRLTKSDAFRNFFIKNICFAIFYPYICIVSIVYRYCAEGSGGAPIESKCGSEASVDAILGYASSGRQSASGPKYDVSRVAVGRR